MEEELKYLNKLYAHDNESIAISKHTKRLEVFQDKRFLKIGIYGLDEKLLTKIEQLIDPVFLDLGDCGLTELSFIEKFEKLEVLILMDAKKQESHFERKSNKQFP